MRKFTTVVSLFSIWISNCALASSWGEANDVYGSPSPTQALGMEFGPDDYVDANGQLVLPIMYDWGHFARKRVGDAHPRGPHGCNRTLTMGALVPRQTTTCNAGFILACPPEDEFPCCPETAPNCCPVPSTVCCADGRFCQGLNTCCDNGQTGCGEACCDSGQTCCAGACCSSGFSCDGGTCVSNSGGGGGGSTTRPSSGGSGGGSSGGSGGSSTRRVNTKLIGIAVGCAVGGLVLIGGIVIACIKRRKKNAGAKTYNPANGNPMSPPPASFVGAGVVPSPYPTTTTPAYGQPPYNPQPNPNMPPMSGAPWGPPPGGDPNAPQGGYYPGPGDHSSMYSGPMSPPPGGGGYGPPPGGQDGGYGSPQPGGPPPMVNTWVERPGSAPGTGGPGGPAGSYAPPPGTVYA